MYRLCAKETIFSLLFLLYVDAFCSTVMAVVTCLVGLHYGHIIVHFKVSDTLYIVKFLCGNQRFLIHQQTICRITEIECFIGSSPHRV